jgi:hypothetical protein
VCFRASFSSRVTPEGRFSRHLCVDLCSAVIESDTDNPLPVRPGEPILRVWPAFGRGLQLASLMKSATFTLVILFAAALAGAGSSAAALTRTEATQRETSTDSDGPYWPAAKQDGAQQASARSRHEPLGPIWTVADEPGDVAAAKVTARRKSPSCKSQGACGKVRAGRAAKTAGKKAVTQKAAASSPQPKLQVKAAIAPPRPPVPVPAKAPVAASRSQSSAADMADQIILTDVTRACTARDANACLMLGRMYATGTVAAKDPTAALKTYRLSCDLGSGAACFTLGQMHEKGAGATVNATEASRYYQLACRRGNDPACKKAVRLSAKAPAFRIQDLFAPKKPVS